MKWVRDRTGRFAERPHYESAEIDATAADLTDGFHQRKYGRAFEPPWRTDDLASLIELHAERLDLYADLETREGSGVEGITSFVRGRRPIVEINQALSSDPRYEHRLRTTLTHECTHVVLHGPLWHIHWERLASPSLLTGTNSDYRSVSHREGSGLTDWMEWQAGYGCGAILMPRLFVLHAISEIRKARGLRSDLVVGTSAGVDVVRRIGAIFGVSNDAARVRLEELRFVRPAGMAAQGSFALDP